MTKCVYSDPLSNARIYVGIHKKDNIKIAVKQILKQRLNEDTTVFAKNEMAINHSLSKISNSIVKVYDYFENEDSFYLVMEYSFYSSYFDDLLETKFSPIPNEEMLKSYALDILNGLNQCHRNNVIHCDLKPQNFLLFKKTEDDNECDYSIDSYDPNLCLKISDFGMSHLLTNNQEKTFMTNPCGTHAYMAPEIKQNCYVDKSIDIWAFGVCLYHMAVGYLPPRFDKYKNGQEQLNFFPRSWENLDFINLKDLIEKCLKYEPENRISVEVALNHPWFDVEL